MAKPGERKVGRTCRYVRADGRYVPARITVAAGGSGPVTLSVTGETVAVVSEMTEPSDTEVWLPGSRRRYVEND